MNKKNKGKRQPGSNSKTSSLGPDEIENANAADDTSAGEPTSGGMREFVEGGSDPVSPEPVAMKESIDLYREVTEGDKEEIKVREFTDEVTEIGAETGNKDQGEPIGNSPETDNTPSFFKSFFVCCVGRK